MEPEIPLPHSQMPATTSHVPFPFLRSYQSINPGPRQVSEFHNKAGFYREVLSTPRPTPELEDNHLSAVRDCLFDIFAAAAHIAGRSSIRNLRTRYAVVTGTHLSHGQTNRHKMYPDVTKTVT